jgi:hypothetical protein
LNTAFIICGIVELMVKGKKGKDIPVTGREGP